MSGENNPNGFSHLCVEEDNPNGFSHLCLGEDNPNGFSHLCLGEDTPNGFSHLCLVEDNSNGFSHLCLGEDNPNLIDDKMVENTNIYRKSNVFLILSSAVKTMLLCRMYANDINLDFYHDVLHWLYK